jgi:trans-aconitate methyltransferase
MTNSAKELAFLRDLYISIDWTERFIKLFDDNFKFSKEEKILYVNAGTGNHTLALREKLDDKIELFPISENSELQNIAQAKADTMLAKIKYEKDFPNEKVDLVIADASFEKHSELDKFIQSLINHAKKQIVFFTPTAGSFGEIFSFFWETFYSLEWIEKASEVEKLISQLKTVSQIEDILKNLGLKNVESTTKTEIFEFKDGNEFINSPLIQNFLLPNWLNFLSGKEQTKFKKKLVEIIDADDQDLSFRFSVKASLFRGEKK